MKDQSVAIRPVEMADRERWEQLYRGYGEFYQVPQTPEVLANVWQWLHDDTHVLEGLVAERGADLVGLAHYRAMPSPLRGSEIGFLDDLFVLPEARGGGVAAALMSELSAISHRRGWQVLRWITADDNYDARRLYDRVGRKTSWNLYELTPEAG